MSSVLFFYRLLCCICGLLKYNIISVNPGGGEGERLTCISLVIMVMVLMPESLPCSYKHNDIDKYVYVTTRQW